MDSSLSTSQLAAYTARQLNNFYPDANSVSEAALENLLPGVLKRLEVCFSGLIGPYFRRNGALYFHHLNSDHYSMYLYLVGNEAYRAGGEALDVAVKSYLLNKALHGIEVYYEVELPAVFWFAHAVGSVLGRARYGNGLVVAQGCTVGNKNGRYPTFGERTVLCANSTVLGDSHIGSRVCIGAGSQIMDETIPDGATVVGSSPNLRVLSKQSPLVTHYFTDTLPNV